MSNRWYRLPASGDGTEGTPYAPDFKGHTVDGWAGNASHPNGTPKWVVRVYADTQTLDDLAAETNCVELSSVPVDALNAMLGQTRDADGWRRGFTVTGSSQ